MSDWAKALEASIAMIYEPVPPEWKTARQLHSIWKIGRNATHEHINRLLEAGKLEKRKFNIKCARGSMSIIHYRVKK